MRPSLKTTALLVELATILILAGWLYEEYMNNAYMRQYINSFLQSTQTGQLLQQLASIGTILVLPLRIVTLFLISVVSMILMLLLLFMFTTFLASVVAGRARKKK